MALLKVENVEVPQNGRPRLYIAPTISNSPTPQRTLLDVPTLLEEAPKGLQQCQASNCVTLQQMHTKSYTCKYPEMNNN